jgi:hypothetical protein
MQPTDPRLPANATPPRGKRQPPPERYVLVSGPPRPEAPETEFLREFCTLAYCWRTCREAMCCRHRRCCAPYGGC